MLVESPRRQLRHGSSSGQLQGREVHTGPSGTVSSVPAELSWHALRDELELPNKLPLTTSASLRQVHLLIVYPKIHRAHRSDNRTEPHRHISISGFRFYEPMWTFAWKRAARDHRRRAPTYPGRPTRTRPSPLRLGEWPTSLHRVSRDQTKMGIQKQCDTKKYGEFLQRLR
eukprot:SAG11_NODE_1272_length_5334_cov_11.636676_3_plen_171_part_00